MRAPNSKMSGVTSSRINLVAIGDVDAQLLDYLVLTLPEAFNAECVQLPAEMNFQKAYNPARRQYHSTGLLASLYELPRAAGAKVLGITELDLFIPIFTFVFGEAQVGGSVALISTHRLHDEFYGLPGDGPLLLTRAEKEAIHELGHASGLGHCREYDCVMRFSNSVEEVDLKTCKFCQLCRNRIAA